MGQQLTSSAVHMIGKCLKYPTQCNRNRRDASGVRSYYHHIKPTTGSFFESLKTDGFRESEPVTHQVAVRSGRQIYFEIYLVPL